MTYDIYIYDLPLILFILPYIVSSFFCLLSSSSFLFLPLFFSSFLYLFLFILHAFRRVLISTHHTGCVGAYWYESIFKPKNKAKKLAEAACGDLFTVTVPLGKKPGDQIQISMDGVCVSVVIPPLPTHATTFQVRQGAQPPNTAKPRYNPYAVEAVKSTQLLQGPQPTALQQPQVPQPIPNQQQVFNITIPLGVKCGDTITVDINGSRMAVIVPTGLLPGMSFQVIPPVSVFFFFQI